MPGVFEGLTVIDVTHGFAGALVTMVLADNGAAVTRVVPPAGAGYRGDPSASSPGAVQWHRGKRVVESDLGDPAGVADLLARAAHADVVVESFRPGVAERLGFGPEALAAANPRTVHCSITGFGNAARWRHVAGYEGVVMAAAGRMADAGRSFGLGRPAYVAVPQASFGAAQAALQGICAALHLRERTGRGAHVEASLLQGITPYDMSAYLSRQRPGPAAPPPPPGTPPMPGTAGYVPARTRDGRWIQWANATSGPHLFWAMAELVGLGHLHDDPAFAGMPAKATPETRLAFWDGLLQATSERTAEEWMEAVLASGDVGGDLLRTTNEGMDHPQVRHNGHVIAIDDPTLGPTEQLGPLARFSATPSRPGEAPSDAGAPAAAPAGAVASAPPGSAGAPDAEAPLAGITVLEAATMYAAPFGPALLADLGARVIKVEPLTGDPLRKIAYVGTKPAQGKESIAIDLKQPEGREVLRRLAAGADLFLHNFRPGVPERLGLDEATLRGANPDLVYVYGGSYGDSGPYAHLPAYHPIPGAVCGTALAQAGAGSPPPADAELDVAELRRWSLHLARANDGNPDVNAALVVGTAMLMGLVARDRFGIGQSVVTTMLCASAYAMSDDWIRYEGKPARPEVDGALLGLGPLYRLYQAADGWVFLACTNDGEWARLQDALGAMDGAADLGDARFATASGRADHADALGSVLEKVFLTESADRWQTVLLDAGVACVRADGAGFAAFLDAEPDARAAGVIADVTSASQGTYWRHGAIVHLDGARPQLAGAPEVGEDTRRLLAELGYGTDEIADLEARHVVGSTGGTST